MLTRTEKQIVRFEFTVLALVLAIAALLSVAIPAIARPDPFNPLDHVPVGGVAVFTGMCDEHGVAETRNWTLESVDHNEQGQIVQTWRYFIGNNPWCKTRRVIGAGDGRHAVAASDG